jgi:thioesterase domain-containing protein/acyl carrier protein
LNRPQLTAEKYVPHPFAQEPGARLYRTGDRVRFLADGRIQFLGRIDHQVKVRGYRIELGEIEVTLGHHPAVQQAVVMIHRQGNDPKIVAYVVPKQGQQITTETLWAYLGEKLPIYMLPTAFVILETLPLTPNGKIDRRALPAPAQSRLDLQETMVAPRDALELELVNIWEEVLNLRPIGIRHNFFELGGHSLLAVRLVNRIQQLLGQELPLAMLFQSPTIESLATVLRQGDEAAAFSSLVPLQVGSSSKRPLFLIHAGGGHIFAYSHIAQHLERERPLYGLQARGLDKEQEPHTQLEEMAAYYIELIQTVQPEGPYLLGGWSVGGIIAFEMARQIQAQGQEVSLLALIDSSLPNTHQIPLWRYRAPQITWFKARRGLARPFWLLLYYLLPFIYILAAVAKRLVFRFYQVSSRVGNLATRAYYGFLPGQSSLKRRQDDATRVIGFAQELFGLPLDQATVDWENLLQLEKKEQLAYVVKKAVVANILPPTIELAYVRQLFSVYEATLQAVKVYVPRPHVERIALLQAGDTFTRHAKLQDLESRRAALWAIGLGLALAGFLYLDTNSVLDALVGFFGMILYFALFTPLKLPYINKLKETLDRYLQIFQDPTNGWGRVTGKQIELYEISGNHYTTVREPNAEVLSRQLQNQLEQIDE